MMLRTNFAYVLSAALLFAIPALAEDSAAPGFVAKSKGGAEQATVVCFGDSVTGVYYHTGSRRAYTDMVEIALQRAFPDGDVVAINAGISGHTTADGLARIEKDVLAHKPDLVTVMFGLNDMTRVAIDDYRNNLVTIIEKCRGAGAEVILCTPNAVRNSEGRPITKLEQYVAVVREVAAAKNAPLVDCYKALEDVKADDAQAWALMMSDDIHPNMDGHKFMAAQIASAVTGEKVSLADVEALPQSIPNSIARFESGERIEIFAMPPFDALLPDAIHAIWPDADVAMTVWPTEGMTIKDIEARAKEVRAAPPHLVFLAVPAGAGADSEDAFIQAYSWILNFSIHFGQWQWDCVAVPPSFTSTALSEEEGIRDRLATTLIGAQDIGTITRKEGEGVAEALDRWLREQRAAQ